jgi:hypothetical protein
MADVLTAIVERKRGEVADRLRGRSFDVRPSTRGLRAAMPDSAIASTPAGMSGASRSVTERSVASVFKS